MTKLSISIDVPNRQQATTFYVDALGCKKLRDQEPNMTVLSAGNVDIYLLEKQAGTNPLADGDSVRRSYTRHWTPIHLDFGVDDVDAAVKQIVNAGGASEGAEKGDWGAIAYCVDPFGNGFCVIRE